MLRQTEILSGALVLSFASCAEVAVAQVAPPSVDEGSDTASTPGDLSEPSVVRESDTEPSRQPAKPAPTASPTESGRWDARGFNVGSPRATADEARNGAQKRSFYGTEILAADLAAFSLLGAGFASENAGVAGLGAVTYLAVPTLIHVGHAEGSHAGASLILRLGFPAMGASIGSGMGKTKCASNEWCMVPNAKYIAGGLVAGAVIASALDISLLGWRSEQPTRTASPRVRPFVSPSRGRLSFGVMGSF